MPFPMRFNPRPCTRGDWLLIRTTTEAPGCFNPRPCTRGDLELDGERVIRVPFQSTPLHEGRLTLLLALA